MKKSSTLNHPNLLTRLPLSLKRRKILRIFTLLRRPKNLGEINGKLVNN